MSGSKDEENSVILAPTQEMAVFLRHMGNGDNIAFGKLTPEVIFLALMETPSMRGILDQRKVDRVSMSSRIRTSLSVSLPPFESADKVKETHEASMLMMHMTSALLGTKRQQFSVLDMLSAILHRLAPQSIVRDELFKAGITTEWVDAMVKEQLPPEIPFEETSQNAKSGASGTAPAATSVAAPSGGGQSQPQPVAPANNKEEDLFSIPQPLVAPPLTLTSARLDFARRVIGALSSVISPHLFVAAPSGTGRTEFLSSLPIIATGKLNPRFFFRWFEWRSSLLQGLLHGDLEGLMARLEVAITKEAKKVGEKPVLLWDDFDEACQHLLRAQFDPSLLLRSIVRRFRDVRFVLMYDDTKSYHSLSGSKADLSVAGFQWFRLPFLEDRDLAGIATAWLQRFHPNVQVAPGLLDNLVHSYDPEKAGSHLHQMLFSLDLAVQQTPGTIGLADVDKVKEQMPAAVVTPFKSMVANKNFKVPQDLAIHLAEAVVGQPEAVRQLTDAVQRSFSGIQAERPRPKAVFLFAGSSGVGKTEMAKSLSKLLDIHLVRIDMSEYAEPHSVSRLVGSPPGYIGYSEGGQLTTVLQSHPRSLVLLDEFEKAHPAIWSLFLQVLDEGTLTDARGNRLDFTQCIFVMTSNLGAREAATRRVGFADMTAEQGSRRREAVERVLPPEFLNRLDGVIYFDNLDLTALTTLAIRYLKDLRNRLVTSGQTLVWSEVVPELLASHAMQPTLGARPLMRLFNEEVVTPVSKVLVAQQSGQSMSCHIMLTAGSGDESLLRVDAGKVSPQGEAS